MLAFNIDGIAPGLKRGRRFVMYGESSKAPLQVTSTGATYNASPTSSKGAGTWDQALTCLQRYPEQFKGIGVQLAYNQLTTHNANSMLCCIDIDHCYADGKLNQFATDIVKKFNTATEISPGGEGVHIFFYCVPVVTEETQKEENGDEHKIYTSNYKGKELEFYCCCRYIRLSGHSLNNADVVTCQEAYNEIYDQYIKPARTSSPSNAKGPVADKPKAKQRESKGKANDQQIKEVVPVKGNVKKSYVALTDEDIVNIIRTGNFSRDNIAHQDKIKTLFLHGSNEEHPSEDDLALCGTLAFFSRCDYDQIDRIFRQSALMRDKWDELRGNGQTYANITINKAIKNCSSMYGDKPKPTTQGFYFPVRDDDDKPIKDILENVRAFLEQRLHYVVKKNLITLQIEFYQNNQRLQVQYDDIVTYIKSELTKVGYKIGKETLRDILNLLATMQCYNPLAEYLEQCYSEHKDDQTDYIREVWNILNVQLPDNVKEVFYKFFVAWLVQGVDLCYNYDCTVKPVNMLVIKGKQGRGKSYFFSQFYPKELGVIQEERKLDTHIKDDVMECTRCALCELSELARSLKDRDRMKQFITRSYDEYRVPYGTTSERHPRHTNFAGTVNDNYFLGDLTGERRFLVLPIIGIDRERINKFWHDSRDKFHAQVYKLARVQHATFVPTVEEMDIITSMNDEYRIKTDLERILYDIYDMEQPIEDRPNEFHTATDIVAMLQQYSFGKSLLASSSGRVLRALADKGILARKKANGTSLYQLPKKQDRIIEMEINKRD